MSIGGGTKKQKTSFDNQQDPWDETVPYLETWLSNLGAAQSVPPGANASQTAAFKTLEDNAKQGNPNASQIDALARSQLAAKDYTPLVSGGFNDYKKRVTGTANGDNLDMANDPYLQGMLTQVADEAQNRINASFAAAGRDFSGANQGAVAKGVTSAQLPLLMDWFNKEQGRTDAAARDLYGASTGTATTLANLDASRNALRSQGVDTTKAALDAKNYGANTILNLQQQMKDLPYSDLATIANLLFPAAGLGQQQTGKSTSKAKSFSFGLDMGDIGKGVAALGTLCDERTKTDIRRIGAMADGTPLYSYRYHGTRQVHIGPMAHEVLARNPDAVTAIGPDRVLIVDLEKASDLSAAIIRESKGAQHGIA